MKIIFERFFDRDGAYYYDGEANTIVMKRDYLATMSKLGQEHFEEEAKGFNDIIQQSMEQKAKSLSEKIKSNLKQVQAANLGNTTSTN